MKTYLMTSVVILAGLAPSLALAQERMTTGETVRSWYQQYLNREPLAGEVEGWVAALQQGYALPDAQALFLGSLEYYQKAGSTPEGFIHKLYLDVTGQAPNNAQLRAWAALASTRPRNEVARQFLAQPQPGMDRHPRDRDQDEERLVRHWHRRYLDDRPDAAEVQYWANVLRRGVAREDVLASMLAGREYYAKVGSTPRAFVRQIYRDIAGREPNRQDLEYWGPRADTRRERKNLADWLLGRFPQNWLDDRSGPFER